MPGAMEKARDQGAGKDCSWRKLDNFSGEEGGEFVDRRRLGGAANFCLSGAHALCSRDRRERRERQDLLLREGGESRPIAGRRERIEADAV